MKRSTRLALAMALVFPAGGAHAADDEATTQLGIRQINEGELSQAVVTLDAVIQRLAPEAAEHAKELSQAYLYKGIALVGLLQEESAKAAFREALKHDPSLRLKRGEQLDRVVRVFEAARRKDEVGVGAAERRAQKGRPRRWRRGGDRWRRGSRGGRGRCRGWRRILDTHAHAHSHAHARA